MAEIEISVLARAALDRRISSPEESKAAVAADSARRNADPKPVKWQFTTADARIKLHRIYPTVKA